MDSSLAELAREERPRFRLPRRAQAVGHDTSTRSPLKESLELFEGPDPFASFEPSRLTPIQNTPDAEPIVSIRKRQSTGVKRKWRPIRSSQSSVEILSSPDGGLPSAVDGDPFRVGLVHFSNGDIDDLAFATPPPDVAPERRKGKRAPVSGILKYLESRHRGKNVHIPSENDTERTFADPEDEMRIARPQLYFMPDADSGDEYAFNVPRIRASQKRVKFLAKTQDTAFPPRDLIPKRSLSRKQALRRQLKPRRIRLAKELTFVPANKLCEHNSAAIHNRKAKAVLPKERNARKSAQKPRKRPLELAYPNANLSKANEEIEVLPSFNGSKGLRAQLRAILEPSVTRDCLDSETNFPDDAHLPQDVLPHPQDILTIHPDIDHHGIGMLMHGTTALPVDVNPTQRDNRRILHSIDPDVYDEMLANDITTQAHLKMLQQEANDKFKTPRFDERLDLFDGLYTGLDSSWRRRIMKQSETVDDMCIPETCESPSRILVPASEPSSDADDHSLPVHQAEKGLRPPLYTQTRHVTSQTEIAAKSSQSAIFALSTSAREYHQTRGLQQNLSSDPLPAPAPQVFSHRRSFINDIDQHGKPFPQSPHPFKVITEEGQRNFQNINSLEEWLNRQRR